MQVFLFVESCRVFFCRARFTLIHFAGVVDDEIDRERVGVVNN